MRLGFEAMFNLDRKTGIAKYSLKILEELKKSKEFEIVEYVGERAKFDFSKVKNNFARRALYFFWLNFLFPIILKKDRIDVLFSPNFIAPVIMPCKSIVVVHDASPFAMEECFDRSTITFSRMIKYSAKKADAIITPSEFSKKDVIKNLKLPAEKIFPIHHGIEQGKCANVSEKDILLFRKKFGLKEKTAVFVGAIEKRKNIKNILKAAEILRKKGKNFTILLIGKEGFGFEEIKKLHETLGLEGCVTFAGYLEDKEVLAAYKASDVLLYPSLYEGFGLPILEAMSCGTPVITSNCTSMPEVGGDAAMYVNPKSPEEIARAVEKIFESEKLKKELSAKGIERAKFFTWEKSVEKTIQVIIKTANKRRLDVSKIKKIQ